jgi:dethiobiotin synthetase
MRGLFVTGTDTGVGKTILSACLLAAMARAGEPVRAHKPVLTGLDEPPGVWPADHELLGQAAGMEPDRVAPLRYGPALSPHLAAELAGEAIDPAAMLARARLAAEAPAAPGPTGPAGSPETIVIIEGVGGLLVPLAPGYAVRDLARELALPVLIAARPGLGTINHTLLTLEAARAAGLEVRAVVLTPWPGESGRNGPAPIERSNRETIARVGAIEVETLARVPGPDPEQLARAGQRLPWRRWLATEDLPGH